MPMTRLPFFLLLAVVASGAYAQQATSFRFAFNQKFGPDPVGLRVVQQYEAHRPFSATSHGQSATNRPLQTLIWYPALPTTNPAMEIGDFEDLISTETSWKSPDLHGRSQDFVHAFMAGTEGDQTVSHYRAQPRSGRFPVIIYAPSVDAPNTENIELCEYLASYGYVVVSAPSMGPTSRRMPIDKAGAEAQAADIIYLLKFADTLPYADLRKAAVIGYSWGGTGALLAAARDTGINALIALDGSFRYSPAPDVDPTRFKIPLLFFSRGETPLVTPAPGRVEATGNTQILSGWTHGDLLQVRMLAVSHIQFSSLFQRSQRFKREAMHFVPEGYDLSDGRQSYGWVARYTLAFLDAYLQNSQHSRDFLMRSPSANGVPPRLMQIDFRRHIHP